MNIQLSPDQSPGLGGWHRYGMHSVQSTESSFDWDINPICLGNIHYYSTRICFSRKQEQITPWDLMIICDHRWPMQWSWNVRMIPFSAVTTSQMQTMTIFVCSFHILHAIIEHLIMKLCFVIAWGIEFYNYETLKDNYQKHSYYNIRYHTSATNKSVLTDC